MKESVNYEEIILRAAFCFIGVTIGLLLTHVILSTNKYDSPIEPQVNITCIETVCDTTYTYHLPILTK